MNINNILTNYTMQFPKPQKGIITIYSKSECNYCSKAKALLEEKKCNFSIINCDKFILENKDEFLLFIREMIGQEYKLFPMVFDEDTFIGGYNEIIKYIDKSLDFTQNF
jgi:glutaredoxin